MPDKIRWSVVEAVFPEDCNLILGQSHFIKTVEDLYETLATSSPHLRFGIAFCEASGPCLVRSDGNEPELEDMARENAFRIAAGHSFVVVLRNGYPINVLNRIKQVEEVCRIYAATANSLQVLVFETAQGRGVAGVVDGASPEGLETEDDKKDRKTLLRDIIGYKR